MRLPRGWTARTAAAAALLAAASGPVAGDSAVLDLGEVFRAPVSGRPWRALRDAHTGAKWFEDERGERAGSADEIARRELDALSPLARVVEASLLAAAQDASSAGETVEVTAILRRQPAHEAGMDARARFAPLLAEPLARARQIVAAAAARREPGAEAPSLPRALEEEARLLTDAEKSELRTLRDRVHSLLAAMRSEVAARAKAEAASDQARLRAWIESRGDAIATGSSWILSSVSCRLPAAAVVEMAESFPEIARIERAGERSVSLDTSTGTVSASSWWNGGYNGSSSTKVAVLDTGIDSGHPALTVSNAAVFLTSGSSQGDFNDSASSADDLHGHGTHVGGIVASADTTYGGVAPGAGLMNAKCGYRTTWGGGSLMDPDIYAAGDWAADNGASVMNCSFGGGGTNNGSAGLSLFFDAAAFDLAIAVAIATGNSGSSSGSVGIPADGFNCVSAGNFTDAGTTSRSDDSLTSSSSRGPTWDGRRKPEISAPGTNITACNATWEGSAADFVSKTGTSMASPHVAGALALLLDYGASWSPEGLKALLLTSGRNTSPAPTSPDDNWGWGGLDLGAAYTCRASVAESSMTSSGPAFVLFSGGALAGGGRVTLAWNRHVASNGSAAPGSAASLLDLDLTVYDATTGTTLGSSASAVNPTEQVKVANSTNGVVIKVKRAGSFPTGFSTEYFAVASESTGATSEITLPALSTTLTVAPTSLVAAQSLFTVTAEVRNTGSATAPSPVVSLGLPSGYSAAGGAQTTLADLAAGATATVSFDVTSPSSGTGSRTITAGASTSLFGETLTSGTASASHTLDASAPTGAVSIDAGAAYTGDAAVTLSLTSSDTGSGLDGMRLRDAGGAWTAWESVAATRNWTLPGEGVDTVEVELRDAAGNVTRVSDAITFDATAPTGSVVLGDGTGYTTATTVTITTSATDAVSGAAEQRISSDGASFGAWEAVGTTHDVSLGTAEGVTRRWAHFRDTAGNVSAAVEGSVTRDVTAPSGSVVIAGGAAYTNEPTVPVDLAASDNLAGVGSMRFTFDTGSWLPWIAWTPRISVTFPTPDASNTLFVQFRDRAGNVSATVSSSIFVDATGPTGSVAIDAGAGFTASHAVTLSFAATDASSGVASVRVRDEGGPWGAWQPYATSLPWTLPAGEGERTVLAQFRDGSGNLSAEVSDAIVRDLTPPTGSVLVMAGAGAVNRTSVGLTFAAADALSGVADVRLRDESGAWSDWMPFAASLEFTLPATEGVRTVCAQFRDAVGNVSDEATDSILLDLTAPSGTLRLAGGRALLMPWEEVLAEPAAEDAGSGVATVEFSQDGGASWSEPLPNGDSFLLAQPDGPADGPAEVRARWRDAAGNVSETATAAVYAVAPARQDAGAVRALRGALAAAGDADLYTLELVAGDVVSVRLPGGRGRESPVLDLFDPAHAQVVEARFPAAGRRAGIARFAAPSTGAYALLVRAGTAIATGEVRYTLRTRIARPRANRRLRGVAELEPFGPSDVAAIRFDAPTGAALAGSISLSVPASFQLEAPGGAIAAFVLAPRRGAPALPRTLLPGATGLYTLRCVSFVPLEYDLRVLPPRRGGRANELPDPASLR